MSNFRTIYYFELKKLLKKKLVWVTMAICLIGVIITVFSVILGYLTNFDLKSDYQEFLIDKSNRQALSGRAIDQSLLEDMSAGYGMIPTGVERYSKTQEYQTYARQFSEIFRLVRSWSGLSAANAMAWEPDQHALYQARRTTLQALWESEHLLDAEMDYWAMQDAKVAVPLTYEFYMGYETIMEAFLTVGFLMILFTAICISSVFPDEHTRRTDQLVLSCPKGRHAAYWAKLLAGITVSTGNAILMTALTFLLSLSVYGRGGFHAAFQLFLSTTSYPITIGQACLISYGILLVTSILVSVLVMFLSELLHSNIAAMSIISGFIIAGMLVQIPNEFRILGQIWDYLPTTYLAVWNVFDRRLISFPGQQFVSYQIIPCVYLISSILLAYLGKQLYQKYQIRGR